MLLKNKKAIKQYLTDEELSISKITKIVPEYLTNRNIEALVLDFDGVLNSHGEINLKPEVEIWLNKTLFKIKNLKVFILSNKPMNARKKYFFKNYPSIKFIHGKRKKPYTDGLEEIHKTSKIAKEKMILVDDRLGTGILAAEIFGCKGLYISKPYTNFIKRPIAESFFWVLRFLEKFYLK